MAATTRLRDWQSRLQTILAARRKVPFAWGTNDCCTFAGDCVLAMTGVDTMPDLRTHRTAAEAAEVLRGVSIRKLVDERLTRIDPVMAAVGDIGLVSTGNGPGLAVCMGLHWTLPGPAGLVTLPPDAARTAWRV